MSNGETILSSVYPWLVEAYANIGLREVPGRQHNPRILNWLIKLGAWWRDDETPWCGVFVASCMQQAGIERPKHWYRAKAWADWGSALAGPAVGCVVVFDRAGGGHVGFVVGRDQHDRLMVLGGNQGNAVSIAPFESTRVLAYRWPPGRVFAAMPLPLIASTAASSSNEA